MAVLADRMWDNLVFIAYNYIIKICQKCKLYSYKLLNRNKLQNKFACGIILKWGWNEVCLQINQKSSLVSSFAYDKTI